MTEGKAKLAFGLAESGSRYTAAVIRNIVLFLVIASGVAHATVRHVPIKSGAALKPGEVYTARLNSTDPVEIGWTAVHPCKTNCIEATQVVGNSHFGFATAIGGSKSYEAAAGKIAVEYKNISAEPVTIDVYRIIRICDAESCKFLDNTKKGHTLVFKVDQFKSITTSKDESYSVIAGVAQSGRPFRFYAIWFTDDKTFMNLEKGCTTWIKRYIDNHTPKEQYSPYIIAGQNVGDERNIVLRSIDDCVGRADHFGVDEKNVFK
ncbi:MAG TPA: hypothetical protein VGF82_13295 [Terracidiphilus sp.]